jgi:hypothetical protein
MGAVEKTSTNLLENPHRQSPVHITIATKQQQQLPHRYIMSISENEYDDIESNQDDDDDDETEFDDSESAYLEATSGRCQKLHNSL